MKQFFRSVISFVLLILICFQAIKSCEITVMPSLRKNFRSAENVFIGEIIKVEQTNLLNNGSPYEKLDKLTLRIEKSWKGKKSGEIIVFSSKFCPCPRRFYEFIAGKKFLIFSDNHKNFNYAEYCIDFFYQLDKEYPEKLNTIKRLDDFWFRTWARIYPF